MQIYNLVLPFYLSDDPVLLVSWHLHIFSNLCGLGEKWYFMLWGEQVTGSAWGNVLHEFYKMWLSNNFPAGLSLLGVSWICKPSKICEKWCSKDPSSHARTSNNS